MPNRILKESIKTNAQIDQLTWFEEVTYYRLLVSADDYGRFDGRVNVLRSTLFPAKDNVTKKAVEDAISKLASAGLLRKYEVNGMPYLLFPTWEKHQRIRNQKSRFPGPPKEPPKLDSNPLSIDRQLTVNCRPESNTIQSNTNPSISAELSSAPSAPLPVISIPLNDGTSYGVTQEQVDHWGKLYPAVNVMQELRAMVGWSEANPTKRKTRRGADRFITSWLSRTQDKGGSRSTVKGTIPAAEKPAVNFHQNEKGEWVYD